MINVLHVADKLTLGDSSIHGVTQLFSMWLPRFDETRYNVSLCSLRTRDSGGAYLEEKGIRVFYLNKGKFDPLTLTDLLRLVRKENVHILHLHGYGSTTFGRSLHGGWFYDDELAPTKIEVCPCTCARFRQGSVEIQYGCIPLGR